MMKCILRCLMTLFAIISTFGCAAAQHQQNRVKRFQGHWATGAGYSFFTLLDDTKTCWVFAEDIPGEAAQLIMRQAMHQSPYSHTRDCRALYLDVLGTIEEHKSSTPSITSHLHVSRILKMEPAHAEFFGS